jgi:hypothetical protein
VRTDQEMPPETRRNHVGSSIIEGPWPAVTSGFLVGETPELQLGTSMLWNVYAQAQLVADSGDVADATLGEATGDSRVRVGDPGGCHNWTRGVAVQAAGA